MELDYSLYPELEEGEFPVALTTPQEQADYIQRVCAAWDFYGLCPDTATRAMMAGWREAFEAFPLAHSPGYGALCELFGFRSAPAAPYPQWLRWEEQDRTDGRDVQAELRLA